MDRAPRFYAIFPTVETSRIDAVLRNFPETVSDEQITSTLRLVLGIHDEAYENFGYDTLGQEEDERRQQEQQQQENAATTAFMIEELERIEERERTIQEDEEVYLRDELRIKISNSKRVPSLERGSSGKGVRGFFKKIFKGSETLLAQLPHTITTSTPPAPLPTPQPSILTANSSNMNNSAPALYVSTEPLQESPQEVVQEYQAGFAQSDAPYDTTYPPHEEAVSQAQHFDEFAPDDEQPVDFEGLLQRFQGGSKPATKSTSRRSGELMGAPSATFGGPDPAVENVKNTADEFNKMLRGFY